MKKSCKSQLLKKVEQYLHLKALGNNFYKLITDKHLIFRNYMKNIAIIKCTTFRFNIYELKFDIQRNQLLIIDIETVLFYLKKRNTLVKGKIN